MAEVTASGFCCNCGDSVPRMGDLCGLCATYRVKGPSQREQIERALHDLLAAQVKAEDAPASAEAHTFDAIGRMLALCPDFRPHGEEAAAELEHVRGYLRSLKKID